jgi:lipopolysaccharide transport system permease protein
MQQDVIIRAKRSQSEYWAELWRFRELLMLFTWRDILVRYKQTVIGVLWALIRPVLTLTVFVIVFGRFAKLDTAGGVPYPLLVLGGMLPWHFFAAALSESSMSLIANSALLTKSYFPRLLLPLSAVLATLVDFAISLCLLFGLLLWFQFPVGPRLLLLPVLTAAAMLTAIGPGLLVTALNVRYRDFRYVIPFVVQIGLYISPVGFVSGLVEERLGWWGRVIYSLNPMVGVIDGFRWCIGVQSDIFLPSILISLSVSLMMLGIGVAYFRATERSFADFI